MMVETLLVVEILLIEMSQVVKTLELVKMIPNSQMGGMLMTL